jgi:hypothetical protein
MKIFGVNVRKEFIFYSAISILILGVLITPGYILSFDMSWGPIPINGTGTDNTLPLNQIIVFFSNIIPNWLIQKIILFLIFFLSGLGAHKLAALRTNSFPYFAGMLYVFNPFVYTRFITGQWLVLLGYALLPWAVRYFYLFLQTPSLKKMLLVIFSTVLICFTSIHTIGILTFIYYLLLFTVKKDRLIEVFTKLILISISLLILNSFWLIPVLKGNSSISENIINFNESQTTAFATRGTVLDSPTISALLLTGFWADDQSRYMLPSEQPIWILGVIGVIVLVGIGLREVIRSKESLGKILALSGLSALIPAIGTGSIITAQITVALSHILPIYAGYREPHKWVMLLSLAYSFVGSIGAYKILGYLKDKFQTDSTYISKLFLLLIPFMFAGPLAFAAAGQLRSTDYPSGWYEAKTYLENEMVLSNMSANELDIVVFPWHQYLPISFSGRVVVNPTKYFFKGNLIVSGDPELTGVEPFDPSDISKYIREEIISQENHLQINEKLKEKSVEYILLLKEIDWEEYSWLDESNLENVLENDDLILYKVV